MYNLYIILGLYKLYYLRPKLKDNKNGGNIASKVKAYGFQTELDIVFKPCDQGII